MPEAIPTQLQAHAALVHEQFTAFVDAGFTTDQALALVCSMLRGAASTGSTS